MGTVFSKKESIDPRFLRPQGLYPPEHLKWDLKVMKVLVQDGKVAPFYPGTEETGDPLDEECPICMLFYQGGLNRARCCQKPICTECYFSIRPPNSSGPVDCPFCQQPKYITTFSGPLSEEERKKQEEESAKVKELENKIKLEEIERDRLREEERKKKREELERQKKQQQEELKIESSRKSDERRKAEAEDKRKAEEIRPNPFESLIGDANEEYYPLLDPDGTAEIEDQMLREAIRLSLQPPDHIDNQNLRTGLINFRF